MSLTLAVALGERLERLLRPEAQQRKAHGQTAPGKPKNAAGKLPEASGDTRDAVGAAVGLSGRTYEKAKAVVEAVKVDPSLKPVLEEMDRTGNIEKAFRAQKRAMEGMNAGAGDQKPGRERIAHPINDQGKARDQAAEMFGVNPAGRAGHAKLQLPVTGSRAVAQNKALFDPPGSDTNKEF